MLTIPKCIPFEEKFLEDVNVKKILDVGRSFVDELNGYDNVNVPILKPGENKYKVLNYKNELLCTIPTKYTQQIYAALQNSVNFKFEFCIQRNNWYEDGKIMMLILKYDNVRLIERVRFRDQPNLNPKYGCRCCKSSFYKTCAVNIDYDETYDQKCLWCREYDIDVKSTFTCDNFFAR